MYKSGFDLFFELWRTGDWPSEAVEMAFEQSALGKAQLDARSSLREMNADALHARLA